MNLELYKYRETNESGYVFGIKYFRYGKTPRIAKHIGKGIYLHLIILDYNFVLHIESKPRPD